MSNLSVNPKNAQIKLTLLEEMIEQVDKFLSSNSQDVVVKTSASQIFFNSVGELYKESLIKTVKDGLTVCKKNWEEDAKKITDYLNETTYL